MDKKHSKIQLIVIVIILAFFLGTGVYLAIKYEYFQSAISLIKSGLSPVLFMVLMSVLPLVFFPISIFLIVGGTIFGMVYFIILWLVVLLIHALIGFFLARRARKPLKRFLSDKMDYNIPEISKNNTFLFSFLFLAVPGIPYAGKNYILPLAGVPFRYCVPMNCVIQGVLGIPFIILGESVAEMDLTLFYITLFCFLGCYVVIGWLNKKWGDKISFL